LVKLSTTFYPKIKKLKTHKLKSHNSTQTKLTKIEPKSQNTQDF